MMVEASESPWATVFAGGEYPREDDKSVRRCRGCVPAPGDGESEEVLVDAS